MFPCQFCLFQSISQRSLRAHEKKQHPDTFNPKPKGRKKKELIITKYGNLKEIITQDSKQESDQEMITDDSPEPNPFNIDQYESFLSSLPTIPNEWRQSYERILSLTTKQHIDTEEKFYQYLVEKLRILKSQVSL